MRRAAFALLCALATAQVVAQGTPGARWIRQPQDAGSLVTIFDAAALVTEGNAIVWQSVLDSGRHMFSLSQVELVRGREYVFSVAVLGENADRIAFGSRRFVAQ